MLTTVQGKMIPLLASEWRAQMRETFELTNRKGASTKQWELSELFPSLKTTTANQKTVKMMDCSYPGAKKPLRIWSSLFCLNTTGQNHISIPFAKLILGALNGQAVDWPEEFNQKLHEEIIKLHRKHSQSMVKVARTTVGLQLTLLIKAAGAMNLHHKVEVGFRMAKTFSTTQPKRRKCTETPPPSPTLQNTVRVVRPKSTDQRHHLRPPKHLTQCWLKHRNHGGFPTPFPTL